MNDKMMTLSLGISSVFVFGLIPVADSKEIYCQKCMHVNVSVQGAPSSEEDIVQAVFGKMSNPNCEHGVDGTMVKCESSIFGETKCQFLTVKLRALGYENYPSAVMNQLIIARGCALTSMSGPDHCVNLNNSALYYQIESAISVARQQWNSVTLSGQVCYTAGATSDLIMAAKATMVFIGVLMAVLTWE